MGHPRSVAEFLGGRRIAVAGVSRDPRQTANLIYRRFRDSGFETLPVNPRATEVEGVRCYPDLRSVQGKIDGLMVVTPASASLDLVRQCADAGVGRIWFHRAFGAGSMSAEAVRECKTRGISCIAGGCPLMYCPPVDPFHRCMRWFLRLGGRGPG